MSLGYALAALLGFTVLVLLPIKLGFSLKYHDRTTDLRIITGTVGPLQVAVRLPMDPFAPSSDASGDGADSDPKSGETQQRKTDFGSMALPLRLAKLFAVTVQRIERFSFRTVVGTGDAAVTSYVTGSLWAMTSILTAWLRRRYRFLSAPVYHVVPDFDRSRIALEIDCIFRFTIGEIIVAIVSQQLTRRTRG